MKKIFLSLILLCFLPFTIQAADLFNTAPSNNLFANNAAQAKPVITIDTYEHQHSVTIIWNIPHKFYLYKDRIKVLLANAPDAKLSPLELPKGTMKNDPDFGLQEVYLDRMSTDVTVYGHLPKDAKLEIRYQGCDGNICLPQQGKDIPLTIQGMSLDKLPKLSVVEQHVIKVPPIQKVSHSTTPPMPTNLEIGSLLLLLGFGILLSLTPCVLPMIPILTGLIVGQAKRTRLAAFFLSLSYVLGMAITYATIGLLISIVGAGFQSFLQTPTAIIISALIFIGLALSMFGLFEINLSSKHHNFLRKIQDRHMTGSYLGAFFMGIISAAVLSPCTSAPLIGVLTHIAQTADYVYGAASLFTLAIGMGIPLILIGTGFGQIIPKAGSWMLHIKQLFGVIMLCMAIWVLSRIMPTLVTQLLYALLIIYYCVSNGVLERAAHQTKRVIKAILFIFLLYAICLFIGTLMGNTNYLLPLKSKTSFLSQNTAPTQTHADHIVHSVEALQSAIKKMENTHSKILVDYYASWCESCHILSGTMQSATIQGYLKTQNIGVIKADVSKYGAETTGLLNHYQVLGMPTLILLNNKGEETARHSGEIKTNALLTFLSK